MNNILLTILLIALSQVPTCAVYVYLRRRLSSESIYDRDTIPDSDPCSETLRSAPLDDETFTDSERAEIDRAPE